MLVDIGANLTNPVFADDLDAVLDRARQAGLTTIIVTGTSLDASRTAIALCRQAPDLLRATVGIHPHEASTLNDAAMQQLRTLATSPGVVAIGETGLDFNRNYAPREAQVEAFQAQLALAADLGLPLFLHERDAADSQLQCLGESGSGWRGVAHCFTGNAATMEAYLELGLHIGITGWICDERRGLGLREIVNKVPRERLLLETDAPYLLPRTLRPKPPGRRNEPAFLPEVLRVVAEARAEDPTEVAEYTADNARRLFALPG